MIFDPKIWWENLYGPSSLVDGIKKEINNKKNVIISSDSDIPWIDYLYEQIVQEHYDFKVDICELSFDDNCKGSTVLKEILELNGIGYQYKGEKNSLKYLESINSEYVKVYFIKEVPSSRADELLYVMKNMSSKSKVLFLAILNSSSTQGGLLKVLKYSDYVSLQDNIRCLKLFIQRNNISNFINDYVAELIGRLEPSVETAIEVAYNYQLGETIDFEIFDENKKKLVWESQLLVFFPLLEKKRNEFIKKYYDNIKKNLPINDVFSNVYNNPEELEIGHIMRLINNNKINVSSVEKDQFEIYYNIRNKLAHQKIVDEKMLLKLI